MWICFPHNTFSSVGSYRLLLSAIQRHFRGMFSSDRACGSFHNDFIIHMRLERTDLRPKQQEVPGLQSWASKLGLKPGGSTLGLSDPV